MNYKGRKAKGDNMFDKNSLKDMTVAELFNLRNEVAEEIKSKGGFVNPEDAKKEADKKSAEAAKLDIERNVRAAIASGLIKYGVKIVINFKGKEQTVEVKGVSEKTFTIATDEGLRYPRHASFVRFAE